MDGAKAAPEPNSSYWVRVLEKAWPSTTIAVPLKLNSDPQASPIRVSTRQMWKTRLPVSRR